LETYVQQNIVKDSATAKEFVITQLSLNIRYTDAAMVSLAHDAAKANSLETLIDLDRECSAVKLPKEIKEASRKLGTRLLKIFGPLCPGEIGLHYKKQILEKNAEGHYPIVFGIYSALLGIEKEDALVAFYYNAAAGMVTNCVKLIPLGQLEGQQLLVSLYSLISILVPKSVHPDRDLIGFCCPGFDIRCMQHERLYSRLYMS
jgi:urease accessory protein